MKKILLLVCFLGIQGNLFANSYGRIYGMLGTGHSSVLNYGAGLSYAWYSTPKENRKLIHAIDLNLFLLGVQDYEHKKYFNITDPSFQMNFFLTYGLGFKTSTGILINFDILGMGINVTSRNDIFSNGIYTKIGTLFNSLGIQITTPKGFYFAWRNTYTGFNWRTTEQYREVTAISDAGEFKTMLIFGYSFPKLS